MTDIITLSRSVVEQALEALKIGRESAHDCAETFHIEMAGYKQQRHEALDAEVKQISDAIGVLRAALEQPQVNSPEIPEGWKLVPTPEMIKEMHAYDGTQYSDPFGSDDFKDDYRNMLAAAPKPPVRERPQVEQEPDWTNSETGLLECWKSPLHPMPDRLLMADGAVAFRDKTISNLRLQIASYQSAQQLPAVEHSSAVQPQGAQEPDAFREWWSMRPSLTRLQAWLIWKDEHKQPPRQPLTEADLYNIASNYFADEWAQKQAVMMLKDHGIGGEK